MMVIKREALEKIFYIPVMYDSYPLVPTILFSIPFPDIISITVVRTPCVITFRILSISVTIIFVFITNSFIIYSILNNFRGLGIRVPKNNRCAVPLV